MLPSFAPLRQVFLADENATLDGLIVLARPDAASAKEIDVCARALVLAVRERQHAHAGMQSFLTQYDLGTQEGVLLMCVAEALLRIPDADTADKLIRDKFSQGDWKKHLGASESLLVNAGTWGMMLTGKLSSVELDKTMDVSHWLGKLAARASEPIVRNALRQGMKLMAEQFVMGRDIGEALARSVSDEAKNDRHSFDMLGEAALTADDAERYFEAYQNAIGAIAEYAKPGQSVFAAPGISVKLSALHPRYEWAHRERVMADLVPKLNKLVSLAREGGIGITFDAEESDRLELSLELFAAVYNEQVGYEGLGLAVQAYQKRATAVIDWLIALAELGGRRIMTRLVKGAYWDTEIKRAQVQGLAGYPVFTRKVNTDVSYLACAKKMLARPDIFYAQFATHNAHTVASILSHPRSRNQFEFQRLHGMGVELYEAVRATDAGMPACRAYAPVGSHEDLLPYLVRRLLENGANSSFVNRIADPAISIDDVVADPIAACEALSVKANPHLVEPKQLYRSAAVSRQNSSGIQFADAPEIDKLLSDMAPTLARTDWLAQPLINGEALRGNRVIVQNPTTGAGFGAVDEADGALVDRALKGVSAWRGMPAQARADALDKAAALLESRRAFFIALMVREAGKTIPDALGELREAADFCRYYAALAREHFAKPVALESPTGESNELSLHPRGVFAAISPWNFPLAIFVGQIAAAFAAGNAVVAKPAEQTPITAFEAVKLLIEAGVPREALAFLPGRGEVVGAALVADQRVAGVVFTGGTATAHAINRALANRPGALVPFIAETGGLNAMIADSSALPEQIVQDVMSSAFNSAGQRCSALRILCVQRDIAPRVMALLKGAMAELRLGDPAKLDTDIGPMIDATARDAMRAHRAKMLARHTLIAEVPLPADHPGGNFFAPCVFEIPRFDAITTETFGPILHVLTFEGDKLMDLVDAINASGYGLTLGIHSRIEDTIAAIRERAHVGNVYVNRNQVGAVVGVQPFGGEGLSGTGPKAGGPHYLFRFATERTFTVNTAAAGGNAALIGSAS